MAKLSAADVFYVESLKLLNKSKIPYLLAGTMAVNQYVGLNRPTKDMDIFCKPADVGRILQLFSEAGYKNEMTDERWLAKVMKGRAFFDIIFNSTLAFNPITDEWFAQSQKTKMLDTEIPLISPTDLIWSKAFVQARTKYDGADVVHLMLIKNKDIDWKRLLNLMDQYWEVLFMHVLNFRFIYPSQRELIPRWLLDELILRTQNQINLPTSKMHVCRGRLFSNVDYAIDVREWKYEDITGWVDDSFKK